MAIITNSKTHIPSISPNGYYPDMFVKDKEKTKDDYVKQIMDYWYTMSISQFADNTDKFGHNYQFVKGKLRAQDFYLEDNVRDFALDLVDNMPLPTHIQQYSIFNQPLNTLCGENSARPDNARVKAYDEDSKSEELQFKTEILNQFITQTIQQKIIEKAAAQGVNLESEEGQQFFQQMTTEQLQDNLTTYTSQAEKWGAKMLENMKMEFNTKELSEEGFRDLLISGREYFHIFQDRSKLGFNLECVNPRNVWKQQTSNKKYTKDAYAAGIIDIMEISEIIEKFPLTKKEIDHLTNLNKMEFLVQGKESNLFRDRVGINSIDYQTYNPAKITESLIFEANAQYDPLKIDFRRVQQTGMLGQKYVVLRAYWLSKKLIGKLTYLDEEGETHITLVDENYKTGDHPYEIDLEWGWENQWWSGVKIGPDIYYTQPLEYLDYCPIIGVEFENRNTEVKSLIDLLKPYQIIFNVCMNQAWEIFQKDKGMQLSMNIRKIPTLKDGAFEDAMDDFYYNMDENGTQFEDDSPENMKAPSQNQSQTRAINLSRAPEIQSRINIALQVQQMANALIGVNNERLGGIAATQTASGTQAALAASYSQTAPWFNQHEYLMNQLYQALLDVAQYFESNKPTSTISYISGTGEHAFIQVNGAELKLRDLRVFITSRQKDQQVFNEMKQLGQAMLQNGASFYDVAQILISDSIRDMQDSLKKDKIRRQQLEEQAQQIQQQQIQSQQESVQMQIQAQSEKDERERQFELYIKQIELDSKERIASIQAYSRQPANTDADNNGVPDIIQFQKDQTESLQATRNYELQQAKQNSELQKQSQKMLQDFEKMRLEKEKSDKQFQLDQEKLEIEREKIKAQIKIAQTNRNRYSK